MGLPPDTSHNILIYAIYVLVGGLILQSGVLVWFIRHRMNDPKPADRGNGHAARSKTETSGERPRSDWILDITEIVDKGIEKLRVRLAEEAKLDNDQDRRWDVSMHDSIEEAKREIIQAIRNGRVSHG